MKKIAFLSILAFFCFSTAAHAATTMNDYCVTPVSSSIVTKPNILLLMDYSGSMQFPAYITCDSASGSYKDDVFNCPTPSSSASDNYDSTKTYYGFFDITKYYMFSSSRFEVNTSCTDTNKIGSSSTCISGNLLNWITATRIDVSRKVLTGGRTNTGVADIYQSEGAWIIYTDPNLQCTFTINTQGTSGAGAAKSRKIQINNQGSWVRNKTDGWVFMESGGTCALATLSASNIDVQPQDPSADTGIIHDFYDKATFEFMIFSDSSSRIGKLLSAKDATKSSLIAAISNEAPFWGTPTGPGLLEAKDYFKQSDDNPYQANTSDISRGSGIKDPWYDGSGTGKAVPCRKSFVLLLSDGMWSDPYVDPVGPALTMQTTDLRSDLSGMQNVSTYAVYAFGDKESADKLKGQRAMKTVAMFGGFDDLDANSYPYPFSSLPSDSRLVNWDETTGYLAGCDPRTGYTYEEGCKEWDKNRSGLPYNYFEADDGEALKTALMNALNDILRRASSGTAASVLASSEGSGANILQSFFYPRRLFNNTEISWIGEMQNLWYYVDPYLLYTSIREDTNSDGTGSNVLNLGNDYLIEFFFDTDTNKTRVRRYSTSANGSEKTLVGTAPIEDIKNLWEAGSLLFQRTSARTIYTTTDGANFLTGGFSTGNSSTLAPYLEATDATKLINWVHGSDQTGCRNRTVTISGATGVWKLGDIVSSTPKIQSSVPLNTYHLYPPDGYLDATYLDFIQDANYKSRGMSYVGGNDGMLHAFKFGNLQQTWSGKGTDDKARLYNTDTSTPLGHEAWAFIPKNVLPYLKYLADPNYCHLNLVDLPSSIVDVSIADSSGTVSGDSAITKAKSSWRTVLIGGMGLGGANKSASDSCTTGNNGTCVKTPIAGVGYSSYFAIDVTDPENPVLLWEFSDPALGFSTSGPAILRIGDPNQNGKWFAVFASGPTGPINTTYHQFMGTSNQNLKLFAVNIATGSVATIDTGVTDAFGGSLYSSTIDVDKGNTSSSGRYSDDVFYLGYTRKDTATSTWTKGGVLRVQTKEDQTPSNWSVSHVISDTNAVTASVTKLQNRTTGKLWLFFGTGRFFYKYEGVIDDESTQQQLYGATDPCYDGSSNTMNKTCTSTGDVRWTINGLDGASGDKGAERVITDPLAVYSGAVFFTTYAPSKDVCSMGGDTYIWAVKYDSGGVAWQTGKAVTQVSTGTIQELDLASVFTEKSGRRTGAIIGMPPKGQGLSVLLPPRPLKKFLHIRQK